MFLRLTLNIFTPLSSVSIAGFQQVNVIGLFVIRSIFTSLKSKVTLLDLSTQVLWIIEPLRQEVFCKYVRSLQENTHGEV